MLPLRYARERVEALLAEIQRLKDSDFPYQHSKDALLLFEKLFLDRHDALSSLTEENDPDVIRNACSESLLQIFKHLPLLGFILRSTNVRNSFEIFGPLLRLGRMILGEDTKLILSSEWEMSPHVYSHITEIPNFVLLGFPASESGNPLLMPLSGHELGHTAWRQQSLSTHFSPAIADRILEDVRRRDEEYSDLFEGSVDDLFVWQNVSSAHSWALKQVEETFCDCMGVRLFGESYLHAFAYILAPGFSAQRSALYPGMSQRIENIIAASNDFGSDVPEGYLDAFMDQAAPNTEPKEQFLLSLADAAAAGVTKGLFTKVDAIISEAGIPGRSEEKIKEALKAFRLYTPAAGVGDLVNIMNAAWQAYHDESFWNDNSNDNPKAQRRSALNEIVLKSIEVLEIEERTGFRP